MSNRQSFSKDTEAEVLTRCCRRCCICFGLNADLLEKQGQIAHLDKDPSNRDPDNLAFLCLPHHDRYDGKTSQSKGFTIEEVKSYRQKLWAAIEAGLHSGAGTNDQSVAAQPVLAAYAEPRIGQAGIRPQIFLHSWLFNLGHTTADDILVVFDQEPSRTRNIDHLLWEERSGYRVNAQQAKKSLHPEDH